MEMEFKDSSRRRTLVLVVGVLLAVPCASLGDVAMSDDVTDGELAVVDCVTAALCEPLVHALATSATAA